MCGSIAGRVASFLLLVLKFGWQLFVKGLAASYGPPAAWSPSTFRDMVCSKFEFASSILQFRFQDLLESR